ncbi:Ninjurin 1 [Mactra antiquata]
MSEVSGYDSMASIREDTHIQHTTDDIEIDYIHDNDDKLGQDEPEAGIKNIVSGGTPNAYVGKRNFIHQMMDVALMMANVSQLKALLVSKDNEYFYILLTFIILSISLQVIFTMCMLAIYAFEKTIEDENDNDLLKKESPAIERKKYFAKLLDRLGNVLVLFIIVSNVFITGFGVEGGQSASSVSGTGQTLSTNSATEVPS